jgi:hypothetical protein
MAAPYATPVQVVQAALHRVGEASISSLNDGSVAASIANSNYEGIVGDYLTRHAWTFATKTVSLAYVGESEDSPWAYEWTWTDDVLNFRTVRMAGRTLESGEFEIQDGKLLTFYGAEAELVASVTYRAIESTWPGDFSEAVVVRMQALFLEGLIDKWQDARLKEKDCEAKILRAIVRDKRQVPAKRVERTKLTDMWRGRRTPAY